MIIRSCFILMCLFTQELFAQQKNGQPNVIIIISDDAGNKDFGFQGSKEIATPNIDRIAREGVRFTQGYVSGPVCSPSRAGMLTGRYQEKFGHHYNLESDTTKGLPLSEKTIANRFKEAGYTTAAFGKWHLGAGTKWRPNARGFDFSYVFLGGSNFYYPPQKAKKDGGDESNDIESKWRRNDEVVVENAYATDAIGRETSAFIRRSGEKPFFLYVAFNAVHSPMQAKKEIEDTISIKDPKRKKLAAMTISLDENVGMILNALQERGIDTNTIVWFINDNGGGTYYSFDNGIYRGYKGSLFEGGIRVPFSVRWPGKIPAGNVYRHPVISLDIAKTSLTAGKAKDLKNLDGINLLPLLVDNKKQQPRSALFWDFSGCQAVVQGDWKLIVAEREPRFLFNLAKDPAEENNLIHQNLVKAKELEVELKKWMETTVRPLWDNGKFWYDENLKYHTLGYAPKEATKRKGFRIAVEMKVGEIKTMNDQVQVISLNEKSERDFIINFSTAVVKGFDQKKYLNQTIRIVGLVKGIDQMGKEIGSITIERPVQLTIKN